MGLLKAVGATPALAAFVLLAENLLPGLAAAIIGLGQVDLLAVIPGTLIAVAAVTAIPARIGARRSVAEVLRAE